MSTCISRQGVFGEHILDADYVCTRCATLDEDALIEELRQARESVSSLTAENERLRAEVERLRKERDEVRARAGDLEN